MAMLADLVELVIGVDTHKQTHTAAVVTATTGVVIAQATVAATPTGYRQLLQLAEQQPGQRIWAIEGTGGYGAGLTRFLHAHAEQVVELDRPKRAARRHGAKSDLLDATRAAREALGRDQLAQPRAAGYRAALQVRLTTRRSAVQAGTDAQRQLHALVVAAPDALRGRLRGLTTRQLVIACGRLRQRAAWDAETVATAASLRALAHRVQLLDQRSCRALSSPMPVAAAIGTTMPRFGIFISQNGVRVTRYSGRVDWSRQASRTSSNEVEVVVFSRTLLVPSATPLGLQRPAAAAGSGRCR
jgi:transposase